MSSNFYPTQLRSFVNKLHGFSQTTVKLSPLSGTLNAGPRSTVVVSLPPNSLILPESFTLWARATTSGSLQTVGGTAVNLPGNNTAAVPATHPAPKSSLPSLVKQEQAHIQVKGWLRRRGQDIGRHIDMAVCIWAQSYKIS